MRQDGYSMIAAHAEPEASSIRQNWAAIAIFVVLLACSNAQAKSKDEEPIYEGRCNPESPPLLILSENPPEYFSDHSGMTEHEKIMLNVRKQRTAYEWVRTSFDRYTDVCLTSPIDYYRVAKEIGESLPPPVGETSSVSSDEEVVHAPYDPAHLPGIYRAAQLSGAHYMVVAKWVASSTDAYYREDVSMKQGALFARMSSTGTNASSSAVEFDIEVHDMTRSEFLFRKRYSAFEETVFAQAMLRSLPGQQVSKAGLYSAPVRKAIVTGILDDIHKAVAQRGQLREDHASQEPKLQSPTPMVLLDRNAMGGYLEIDAWVWRMERRDTLTEATLWFRSASNEIQPRVSLARNASGLMGIAKTTSGQVYRVVEDSNSTQTVHFDGGRGSMKVAFRNDLGALGKVSMYFDVRVQTQGSDVVRRVTFPLVEAL
ncbi:MAG: hypothetical protein ACT4NL_06015 [Pseudomarimonas sp.]